MRLLKSSSTEKDAMEQKWQNEDLPLKNQEPPEGVETAKKEKAMFETNLAQQKLEQQGLRAYYYGQFELGRAEYYIDCFTANQGEQNEKTFMLDKVDDFYKPVLEHCVKGY